MFYGLLFAYDEGLGGDDATLAASLWRYLLYDSVVNGVMICHVLS